jgi:hypothetical protein
MKHIQILSDAFDIYGSQYRSLGDYSATTLINPPRLVALTKRYGHEVKQSVDSQAASIVGTAVHEKMERLLRQANVANSEYMLERDLVHPFTISYPEEVTGGGILMPRIENKMRLVSGRFDILHKEQDMYDLKTAKTWKLVFDPEMIDWHQQQNIYAYLLRMRGIEVQTLNIVVFYLDWIESQSLRSTSYPQSPIVQYRLKLWEPQQQEEYIMRRLKMHVQAESTPDDELPPCTQEERWERDPSFAIMKNSTAKRAVRVIKSGTFADALEEARKCKGLGSDSYIEVRHQQRKRCEKYCMVNDYCNVHQSYLAAKQNNANSDIFPLAEVL